jgi:hypothetical protein
MYVGLLRSLFSRSNSSTSNSQRSGDEFSVNPFCSNLVKYIQEVLNKTFQLHHIPDILKIGILFPVLKNKGDCKNAKNYRGITVTLTLSKIIEKILKIS